MTPKRVLVRGGRDIDFCEITDLFSCGTEWSWLAQQPAYDLARTAPFGIRWYIRWANRRHVRKITAGWMAMYEEALCRAGSAGIEVMEVK